MNIVMNGPALRLRRRQRLKLIDAAGAVARVVSGRVWITLENDRRDIFLARGDTWTIDRDGLTLVQAEPRATLVLVDSPRPRLLTRLRAMLGRWRHARRPGFVPYY
ncbi:MAG TPA: DUF2917 domain-containing protein [Casimicrobiaceae bacterium]|nr:DUF2917 domain-containing protein [Casimicrobiaceae bacterium]